VSDIQGPPIDGTILPPPSAALIEFVKQRAATKAGWREMRRTKRIAVQLEVVVQPLNESNRPSGRPFPAVTRDVSTGGLCLMHTRPAPTAALFVEIQRPDETPLYVVLKVLRNRPVGPFYEIAGEFVPIDADASATAQARLAANRPSQAD
jgi:PilZ domain